MDTFLHEGMGKKQMPMAIIKRSKDIIVRDVEAKNLQYSKSSDCALPEKGRRDKIPLRALN